MIEYTPTYLETGKRCPICGAELKIKKERWNLGSNEKPDELWEVYRVSCSNGECVIKSQTIDGDPAKYDFEREIMEKKTYLVAWHSLEDAGEPLVPVKIESSVEAFDPSEAFCASKREVLIELSKKYGPRPRKLQHISTTVQK